MLNARHCTVERQPIKILPRGRPPLAKLLRGSNQVKLSTVAILLAMAFATPTHGAGIKLCKILGSDVKYAVPVPTTWSLADCQALAKKLGGNGSQALCLYEVPIGNEIALPGSIIPNRATPTAQDLPNKRPSQDCGWTVK
jgi:hypothetical protein